MMMRVIWYNGQFVLSNKGYSFKEVQDLSLGFKYSYTDYGKVGDMNSIAI